MKKYFLKNEDGQIGPFSPEELKEKGIESGTPIWYDGLEQWTTAGELEELKGIFSIPAEPVPDAPAPVTEPEPAAAAAETVSSPLPAAEPIVTEAAPVAAPIVAAATATAAEQPALSAPKPARKRGNPVISWALSLAVLGGAGYYVYQDMEKNKDSAPVVQGQEITISDTDLSEEKKEDTESKDPEPEKQYQTISDDTTVTAPVTEEKKETVAPPVTPPVTDPQKAEAEKKKQALAKKAEEDKKKQLAAEAKKKEEERKKLLAAQAQAAKEMAMRNAWQTYITIGPYKVEGDDKVKPFTIPVYNAFPVSVDKVTLRVDYIKKEKIVATETLTLGSIPAKGNLQVQATGNKKGHTANVYITGAGSRALHFCFPSTGGKPGDQYYCN